MNKQYPITHIILISIFLTAFTLSFSEAAIIQVPRDFNHIQAALNSAKNGDTVKVAPGLYQENIIWPEIPGIKLIGSQKDTLIDGGKISHVILFNMKSQSIIDGKTLISGFKIQNGKAPKNLPYGGGIYLKNSSPKISHVIIMSNNAERGGAIYCEKATIDLDHSIISGNIAINGGGIYFSNTRTNLSNMIITKNTASQGSGLSFFNSNAHLINTTLMDNMPISGDSFSSLIFAYNASLDIQKSVLWNEKIDHEIYFSEFSHKNKSIIEHSNFRKGKKSLFVNDTVELKWQKSNTTKTPKPFGLHIKKDTKDVLAKNISNSKSVTINGLGAITSTIEIYANGEKISGITPNITNDTFSIKVPLSEGTHTITAHYPGQTSETKLESDPIIVTVDTISPAIVGIKDDPQPKSSKTWQWTAKDADSNIQYRYLIDQQPNSAPKGSYTQTNSVTIANPDFHDGKWYIHIQAIDTALNESSVTTVSAILDSTMPVMSGLENELTPVQIINWSWNAMDQTTGTHFRYLIDKKIDSKPSGEFSEKTSVIFKGADGLWYIHVQAKDRAGNLSDVVTVSAIIDKTAPVITGLADDSFPQKSKTWNWKVEDADNHITYRYKICQNPETELSGNFTSTNNANITHSDGKWYIHVQARDRAGNLSETLRVSAILDNKPPQIEGLVNDDKAVKQKHWAWKISDTDKHTRCRYLINQQAVSVPSSDFQGINKAEIIGKQGKWYLHVQAIDGAGNLSKVVSVSCQLDNTPPIIMGLKDQHIPVNAMHWNWQANDNDSNIVFRYQVNQSPKFIFTQKNEFQSINSAEISKMEGKWYLHVQAKDSAGNLSEKFTVSVILDNTPPVITGISSDPIRIKEKKWSWDSVDKDQYILYRYLIDELADSAPHGPFTNTKAFFINDLNGTYYIHIQAKDRAGNLSKIVHASTQLDNTPPMITGLFNDPSPCKSKIWHWGAQDKDPSILFRFTVNTDENSAIGGHFSGITKTSITQQNGLYYLHVQAKDTAGNLSKIVTVSTLLDNTPPLIKGLTYDNIPKKSVQWKWQILDIDQNSLCRFQINQKSTADVFNEFSNKSQISISDINGRWFLHVQAKDSAGNLSEITTASAILDNTPPVIMGLSDAPMIYQKKEWQWHAEDSDTFIQYRYLIDQTKKSQLSGIFQNISNAKISNSNGLWYLNVQAKDRAGNLSRIVSVSTVLDIVPPIIKGLSDDHIPKQKKNWSWYAIDDDPSISFRHTIDNKLDTIPSGLFNSKTKATIKNLDGKWFIHVQARDSAGNISDVITASIVLDNTPPEILGVSDDFIPKKEKQWSWHTKDQDSQIFYRFNVDSSISSSIMSSYTETSTKNISDLDGVWYLNLQAKDRAGNLSDIVSVKTVLDNTPPVITGLNDDPKPQKMKLWQWNCTDNDTQISYRYVIDEHAESQPTGSFTNVTNASIDNVNGKWYLHVQAKDRAGNLSQVSTVSVILDSIPPIITGLSSDTHPVKSIKWIWNADDKDSNVVFRYLINQIDRLQLKNSYNNVTTAKIENTDGKWFLHVQAMDSAGNESDIVTVSAILDNTPPVIQGLSNEHIPLKEKTWNWSVADKDSQVKYKHHVNQESQPHFTSTFTDISSASVSDRNGKWHLHVQARDRAGNYSEPLSVFAYFDNTRPEIQGLFDDDIPKKKKLWQWLAKDNDEVILYRYVIDQIAHSKPYNPFNHLTYAEQKDSDGLWYIHVQAKDRAGNLSDIVSVSALFDNTPPVIHNLTNDDVPQISKKWDWTIEDDDPEVLSRYSIAQESFFVPSGTFQKKTIIDIAGLEGKYYLHVQAKDRANNISNVVSVYTILDQTPPVITGLMDDRIPKKIKIWQWSAFDNDSNILYRYLVDQKSKSTPTGSFMKDTQAELSKPDGKWFIHVQAKDRAGHLSEIISVSAIIDNNAPIIKGLSDDLIPQFSKTWHWSAIDADSNIRYRHVLSQDKNASLKGTFTNETKRVLDKPDGKYFLRVQAVDTAGNISEIVTVSAIIDKTPPVIQGLSNDDAPLKHKKWEWQALDSDPEVTFRYIIDENPHSNISGIFRKQKSASISKENGIWYLHVQARDRAGNLSKIIDVYTLLDNTPPKLMGLYDDIIPRKKKLWQWKGVDKDSNIVFRYIINQLENCPLDTPFTQKKASEIIQKNGKWYLHAQAKDSAGNLSDIQTVYTIIDSKSKGLHIDLHIHFDSNKDFTEILFIDAIKRIANILKKYSDAMAVIEAHSDNIGEDESNQKLSERRAENVRTILIKKYHISSSRLKAVGYGSTKPIADNSTKEGRRKNRRADAYIYHTD
ncbi:cell wall associated biofilm protein [Candidatus Magnetomorum sp. HK-1]|nr:cell wall associated biofilm protein [Candidatus Magnetomorum sp. HK-1]